MFKNNDYRHRWFLVFMLSLLTASCVTESVETAPAMRFSDAAVISVQDPAAAIVAGSTVAWLPEAVHFYEDERLKDAPLKPLIENEIVKNLRGKFMLLVDPGQGAQYAIAYTAALESSLDDNAIISRFGLLPGHAQVPADDDKVEKGAIIIYLFDNKTDKVIWRSAAQASIYFDTPAEQRKARVQRVIGEMFGTFPAVAR